LIDLADVELASGANELIFPFTVRFFARKWLVCIS
jgi:hypothetical protein